MPTNQERSNIQAEINQYVYPDVTSPLSTTELDYILDKQGDYRKLAILEAARGIMVKKFYEPAKVDVITGEIVSLQGQIYKELKNTQAKESWHSKYDNMSYSQIANIASEVKEECPDCINGVRHSAFDDSAYPCSCGLGQKLSVTTNYMGPITILPAIPSKTNLANTVKVVPKLPDIPDIPDIPKKTKLVSAAYNKLFGKKPEETLKNSLVPKKAKKCNHPSFASQKLPSGKFILMCGSCNKQWSGNEEQLAKATGIQPATISDPQETLGSYYTKAFIKDLKANTPTTFLSTKIGQYFEVDDKNDYQILQQPGQSAAPVSTPLQVEEEPQGRKFRNARTE